MLECWSENEFGSRNAEVGIAEHRAERMEWRDIGVAEYWSAGVLDVKQTEVFEPHFWKKALWLLAR
jgi:hypothetical protein